MSRDEEAMCRSEMFRMLDAVANAMAVGGPRATVKGEVRSYEASCWDEV